MTHRPAIVPYFSYRDAKAAMTFLRDAFGLEPVQSYEGPDGRLVHAEMRFGNGVVMLGSRDAGPVTGSQGVYLVVPDVDAHHARAAGAGAEIVQPPSDDAFGARSYRARDSEGHEWSFGTYQPCTETPQWP